MPTKKEREYYRMGFFDGRQGIRTSLLQEEERGDTYGSAFIGDVPQSTSKPKRKRPLNSWQKFVKANSKKRKFRFKDGKLKLKSMGIAYRKTAAYKRSKK